MLSYNKTAMGTVSTAIRRAGAELGSPNPPKMLFYLQGSGWQQDVVFGIVLDFPSRHKTRHCGLCVLEHFVLLFGVPVQPPGLGGSTVCNAHGICLRLVSQEAPAETKLKRLSIQLFNY